MGKCAVTPKAQKAWFLLGGRFLIAAHMAVVGAAILMVNHVRAAH